jgi:Xaa-Pro aminopeptidase
VVTDSRYFESFVLQGFDTVNDRAVMQRGVMECIERGFTSIGIEYGHLSFAEMSSLHESFPAVEFFDCTGLFVEVRKVKSDSEVASLRLACSITERAFQQLFTEGLAGKTELHIAGRIEQLFRELGADDRAFSTIVASGEQGAIAHHSPNARIIREGDLVTIDAGARVAGYHADMTRTVAVAYANSRQSEIYEVVESAQWAALAAVRGGYSIKELDAVARNVIAEAGFGEYFTHGLGHGVGVQIHESPMLGREEGILQPCMPITIEPGIYIPGFGGVRIEDTVLVSDSGYEALTRPTRGLVTL